MARRKRVRRGSNNESKSNEKNELQETFKEVEKRYGEGVVSLASSVTQPDRISTGPFTLDFALLGGIPHNRVSMVVGERHSGKSTLACMIAASAQRMYPDQTPVYLDIESTFDPVWAEKLGVDTDTMPVITPDSGEMAVDIADAVIGSQETSLLIVDSIAALVPMKEIEASAEDAFVGLQARLVGNFIRRVTSSLVRERRRGHKVTVLLINQFRMKIGVSFGDPRTLPGGKALEFATSVQIIIKNKENKGRNTQGIETMTHNEHSFTITKNKLNGGPRTGEFVLVREYDEDTGLGPGDIDDAATVLAFAKKFGVYHGGGQRWTLEFDDIAIDFKKAAEAVQTLRDDRELYWALRTHLIRLQAEAQGMPQEFIERIV